MQKTGIWQIDICLITWKRSKYILIFGPNAIQYLLQYSLRGRILQPQTITLSLHLLFDLDTRDSVFALTTNLEVGSHFAKIWGLMNQQRDVIYEWPLCTPVFRVVLEKKFFRNKSVPGWVPSVKVNKILELDTTSAILLNFDLQKMFNKKNVSLIAQRIQ